MNLADQVVPAHRHTQMAMSRASSEHARQQVMSSPRVSRSTGTLAADSHLATTIFR
jgi:hypothetical protein